MPPNYGDEEENVIPYEVRGIQRGRVLTLEIGNMVVTEEESE